MKINYLLISLITFSTNVLPLSLKTFVFSPHASESENSNVTACFLKHVHNYLYVDSFSETAYCYCGDDVCTTPYYHKHVMEAVRQGSKIRFKCSICGYIKG